MTRRNPQQRRSSGLDWVLVILIFPGLIGALTIGAQRYEQEKANRSVEFVLDYQELQNLSVSSGKPIPEVLERFKKAGVTGVAISEDVLGDMAKNGLISLSAGGSRTQIDAYDSGLTNRLRTALSDRGLPPGYGTSSVQASPATLVLMRSNRSRTPISM